MTADEWLNRSAFKIITQVSTFAGVEIGKLISQTSFLDLITSNPENQHRVALGKFASLPGNEVEVHKAKKLA